MRCMLEGETSCTESENSISSRRNAFSNSHTSRIAYLGAGDDVNSFRLLDFGIELLAVPSPYPMRSCEQGNVNLRAY